MRRRYTQLALADEAEVSTRHISYLETGRAKPSREMVMLLASQLEMPLGERNHLLLSAGFAPAYRTEGLASDDSQPLQKALRFMLRRHQPYPATVVDPQWNLLMANDAYTRLLGWFAGEQTSDADPERIIDGGPLVGTNTLEPLFDPNRLRPMVVNFDEVAGLFLGHLRRAARDDASVLATLQRLERFGPVAGVAGDGRLPLVIPLRLHVRGEMLTLFTTMTMFGTAMDTVVSSLRLETVFPGDEASDALLRRMATSEAREL